MKRSLLMLLLGLLVPVLPATSFAQAKLKIVTQQARSDNVELTAEKIAWAIQVRDLCVTVVKKQEVRVPCSPWRPLLPTDGERKPFFKGEVELPDGGTRKLLGRRGPAAAGEQHSATASLTSPAPSSALELPLEHDPETPGRWAADTEPLGDVLLRSPGGADEPWVLTLRGTVESGPILWGDETKTQDYSIETARLAEFGASWRCAALTTPLANDARSSSTSSAATTSFRRERTASMSSPMEPVASMRKTMS
jgi:hypothetical protein